MQWCACRVDHGADCGWESDQPLDFGFEFYPDTRDGVLLFLTNYVLYLFEQRT
jgi:hypothetical protein